MTEKDIEKYIDDYIDMGLFARPEEARPYLIDGFLHGYEAASKLSHNSDYAKCPECKGDTYTSLNCLKCDYSESLH